MSSKAIIVLIVAVVLVGFLAAFFLLGDSGLDEFSIKSNDESAELIIPKDTLPDSVNVDDISVTRISNSQFEDESLIVYELEPDGLVFKDEILFKVSLDGSNNLVPMVFVSTSTGIDLVDNTLTEVDLETKKQNVTVPLTHFSKVWIKSDHGVYDLVVSASDTPEGERVLTNAKFTLYKDNYVIGPAVTGDSKVINVKFLAPQVSIMGFWSNLGTKLTPVGDSSDKPGLTTVFVGQSVTVDDDAFTCIEPGVAYLWYSLVGKVNQTITTYESVDDWLLGNAAGSVTQQGSGFRSSVRVYLNGIEVSEDPKTDPEEEPMTDPRIDPEVNLSSEWILNSDGLRTHSNIYVDITAQPGANVTVTLSGPSMSPKIESVTLDESGQTRITFEVYPNGEYTAVVEIGKFSIEKSVWT